MKCISRSPPGTHSSSQIIETALTETQLQKKRLIAWANSIPFQGELSVDGIVLASGEGDTKDHAKEAAYNAAVELLNKPYLQIREKFEMKRLCTLVGSDEPFDPVLSSNFPYKQNFVSGERDDHEKQPSGYQYVKNKNSASCADENKLPSRQHLETLPARSLSDFIILRNHFEKKRKASINILQQSADFNKWPLSYHLTEVEAGCRCHLTLGNHTFDYVVAEGKKSAKKAAAEQALERLSATCYTVQLKKFDIPTNALTRNEV